MNLAETAKKYPKGYNKFLMWINTNWKNEYVTDTINIFRDQTSSVEMISDYELNGLIQEFFREKNIYFSIMPRFAVDDSIKDYTVEICYGVMGWTGYHQFQSYEEANDFAIEKCFEILEEKPNQAIELNLPNGD